MDIGSQLSHNRLKLFMKDFWLVFIEVKNGINYDDTYQMCNNLCGLAGKKCSNTISCMIHEK